MIAEDIESCLISVIVFSKVSEQFKKAVKEQKHQVREWKYDEEAIENDKKEQKAAVASSKEQWANLLRLLKTNFSEVFSGMLHVKCLRAYVEGVLRYGLPPTFGFYALKVLLLANDQVKGKNERKLRENILAGLQSLESKGVISRLDYERYQRKAADSEVEVLGKKKEQEEPTVGEEEMAAAGLSEKHHPYVCLNVTFSLN